MSQPLKPFYSTAYEKNKLVFLNAYNDNQENKFIIISFLNYKGTRQKQSISNLLYSHLILVLKPFFYGKKIKPQDD